MTDKFKLYAVDQKDCLACTPDFDEAVAVALSSAAVRKKYPRWSGLCNQCGYNGIKYASKVHYIYGDW